MNKLFYIISWFAIISAMVLLFVYLFWQFYPYKTIKFNTPVYKVLNENKTVKQGGVLIYEIDYCKYTDQEPVVTKYYVDGIVYQTSPARGVVKKGCHVTQVYNDVPKALPPGEYNMKVLIDYSVNPIRDIFHTNFTEKFTVIK